MILMMKTRNAPGRGEYVEGKKYPADAFGRQLVAQGFAIEVAPIPQEPPKAEPPKTTKSATKKTKGKDE